VSGENPNPSLFDGLPPGEEKNIPLLLERIYGRFNRELAILRTQVGGRMTEHNKILTNQEGRLGKLENCPCAVHRDPGHRCVILDTNEKLSRIEAKMDAKINPIKMRLAYILGGLGLLAFLLDLAARLLPLFWR
jgi:hypothetical protein